MIDGIISVVISLCNFFVAMSKCFWNYF